MIQHCLVIGLLFALALVVGACGGGEDEGSNEQQAVVIEPAEPTTQPDPEPELEPEPVPGPGERLEYAYAISSSSTIPNHQRPNNFWGFDIRGTVGGLTWYVSRVAPSVTEPNQYLFRSARIVAGRGRPGDLVSAVWSTPRLISSGQPELEPEPVDLTQHTIDNYTCTNEREGAVGFSSIVDHDTAAPLAWNGTPFEVFVSSSFSNAHELLDAIVEEAARVRTHLGYEIFVAGGVIPMVDIEYDDLHAIGSEYALLPADYEIPFYCCDDRPGFGGHAQIFTRSAVLSTHPDSARHVIIHELYHLLGFDHPGDSETGVEMSDMLYNGRLPNFAEQLQGIDGRIPTGSTALDLAKLSCIYD